MLRWRQPWKAILFCIKRTNVTAAWLLVKSQFQTAIHWVATECNAALVRLVDIKIANNKKAIRWAWHLFVFLFIYLFVLVLFVFFKLPACLYILSWLLYLNIDLQYFISVTSIGWLIHLLETDLTLTWCSWESLDLDFRQMPQNQWLNLFDNIFYIFKSKIKYCFSNIYQWVQCKQTWSKQVQQTNIS